MIFGATDFLISCMSLYFFFFLFLLFLLKSIIYKDVPEIGTSKFL